MKPIPPTAEQAELRELIERFSPELPHEPERVAYYTPPIFVTWFSVFGLLHTWLGPERIATPMGFFLLLLSTPIGLGTGEVFYRWRLKRSREAFYSRMHALPLEAYATIVHSLKRGVVARREEALGEGSAWHRARQPLAHAKHEADRSARYWEERIKQQPENEGIRSQLQLANALSEKFGSAIAELDRRTDALRTFLDRCEAKLAVLESNHRDIQETQRLSDLSDRAGEVVANASAMVESLGREFVQLAFSVGEALGTMERIVLKQQAVDLPIEKIESVADRILASSEEQEAALNALSSSFAPDAMQRPAT